MGAFAGHARIEYRVLGPLQITRDGRPCTPNAPKQRALLALLLLHANELLPAGRIIDELWHARPPPSATAALQMYVSGIRRALCSGCEPARLDARHHPVLRTELSGYVLQVEPGDLDLIRFHALAAQGRATLSTGNCLKAGDWFCRGLALWRGAALADLSGTGMLTHYAVRLDEERLALWQDRIGVDICQGRSADIIGELGQFCALYPLREAFHEQLMLALYRCGRRAEALEVYGNARRAMVEQAGIEPGPGLRAAQQAILAGRPPCNSRHEGHSQYLDCGSTTAS